MPEFTPGSRHGSFHIVAKLGRGMSGSVYQAVYKDGTHTALKFLDSRDDSVRSYFLNEVTLLRQAKEHGRKHSHIIEYVTSNTMQEPFYLATRFFTGSYELTTALKAGITPGFALKVAEQLAGALDYLHHGHPSAPVIHRDVKPPNILINPEGDVLLIDLGAACYSGFRLQDERGLGTPQYMPPEQYDGDEQPQTDQFALAMLVHQMLTGRPLLPINPGPARKKLEVLRDSGQAELRASLKQLPAVAEVLARATLYDWQQRYPSCEEFVYDLRLALRRDEVSLEINAPSPARRALPWSYIGMGGVAAGALALLLINPFAAPAQLPAAPPTATLVAVTSTMAGTFDLAPAAQASIPGPTSALIPTATLGVAQGSTSQVTAGSTGCALRANPSTDAAIIRYDAGQTLIPAGVSLTVLAQDGSWYNVRLSDGRSGWCARYQLATAATVPVAADTQSSAAVLAPNPRKPARAAAPVDVEPTPPTDAVAPAAQAVEAQAAEQAAQQATAAAQQATAAAQQAVQQAAAAAQQATAVQATTSAAEEQQHDDDDDEGGGSDNEKP